MGLSIFLRVGGPSHSHIRCNTYRTCRPSEDTHTLLFSVALLCFPPNPTHICKNSSDPQSSVRPVNYSINYSTASNSLNTFATEFFRGNQHFHWRSSLTLLSNKLFVGDIHYFSLNMHWVLLADGFRWSDTGRWAVLVFLGNLSERVDDALLTLHTNLFLTAITISNYKSLLVSIQVALDWQRHFIILAKRLSPPLGPWVPHNSDRWQRGCLLSSC